MTSSNFSRLNLTTVSAVSVVGFLLASCGGSVSDSTTDTDSGMTDSATADGEFTPTSIYWAIAEAEWDGENLTSFFRSADDSEAIEPYIDLRLLELDFLQQVDPDKSCTWVSRFRMHEGSGLRDPLESTDYTNWDWVHIPLEFSEIETNCDNEGASDIIENFSDVEMTLSLGPILQHVEVEVVQMLQTLGYDHSHVAGRLFGTRLGWTTSDGEEVWRDVGWGASRRLDQGALFTEPDGSVELQQIPEEIPPGALAIYGLYAIELDQLLR